jgi:hypothetical protein
MASRAATEGAPKAKRPGQRGKPTKLTQATVLHEEVLPHGEAIARLVRTGMPLKEAAMALGLDWSGAYKALGEGRAVASLILEGRHNPDKLTPYQAAALDYFQRVDRAEAEGLALAATALSTVMAGGHVRRRTEILYDAAGNETGRKVVEDVLPPDRQAQQFWLERRRPDLFGRAERVELALGADGPVVQTASPRERLVQALADIERRKTAARDVIDIPDQEERTA